MEKIDRLGWADGVTISPHGAPIGIRLNDPAHLPHVETLLKENNWAPVSEEEVQMLFSLRVGPSSRRGRKNYHLLYAGATRVVRTLELQEVFDYLHDTLPEIVRVMAKDTVFVPGSVVSLGQRLLILPAGQGSGQTTLLRELTANGARLLAESFFAISPQGELRLDSEAADATSQAVICFTKYSPRNKTLRATRITPGESSLYLFSNGLNSRLEPALALQAVSRFATKSTSIKGNRGEAPQAADYLRKKVTRLVAK
jgi:hypothetical protein